MPESQEQIPAQRDGPGQRHSTLRIDVAPKFTVTSTCYGSVFVTRMELAEIN